MRNTATFALPRVTYLEADSALPKLGGYVTRYDQLSKPFRSGLQLRFSKGAFASALKAGNDVLALANHDSSQVLGRTGNGTLRIWEDSLGLRYELLPPNTTLGRDIVELVRRGDVVEASVGFLHSDKPGDEEWLRAKGSEVLQIHRVEELADVTICVKGQMIGTSTRILDGSPAVAPKVTRQSFRPRAIPVEPICGTAILLATRYGQISREPTKGGRKYRFDPGAFREVLAANPTVRALIAHDLDTELARSGNGGDGRLRLSESAFGLHAEIDLPDGATGRYALKLIRSGEMSEASISWNWKDEDADIVTEGGEEILVIHRASSLADVSIAKRGRMLGTSTRLKDAAGTSGRTATRTDQARLSHEHRMRMLRILEASL